MRCRSRSAGMSYGCWSSSRRTCSPVRPSPAAWASSRRLAGGRCPTSASRCGTASGTGPRRRAMPSPRLNRRPKVTTSASRDQVLDRYAKHVNKSLASLARLVAAPAEVSAAGSKVLGSDGHLYLDCGGFGVFLLGHCHPAVVAAVRSQLERNPLATRLFLSPELAQAAADLAEITPSGLKYVFLTNSGAEATELGLKLARLAGKRHVIAMHGGFHGKTLGALSVSGAPRYRGPFGPLLPMVDFVPFGDLAALQAALTAQSVVLLEPVQAEGGVRLPPDGYLRQVRQACTEAGAVMILDEIHSGMGRLGAWWGADLAGVTPDALLTGKILGGGVMPAGGVVASAQLFAPLNTDPL